MPRHLIISLRILRMELDSFVPFLLLRTARLTLPSQIEGLQATLTSAMATAWTGPNAWGSYVNYVDPTLTPHEAQERYWGTQYPRLSRLKSYYDPKNVLGTGQAIMGS